MPSGNLENLYQSPERRETLLTAQFVGRELLHREFASAGMNEADADAAITEITRVVDEKTHLPNELDGDALSGYLRTILSREDDLGVAFPELVRRQKELAAQDVSVAGLGSNMGLAIRNVSLGLALLLMVGKCDGKYDLRTGEGYLELQRDVPAGFQEIMKLLVEQISSTLRSHDVGDGQKPDSGGKGDQPGVNPRVKRSPARPSAPPAQSAPAARPKTTAATDKHASPSYLCYDDALTLRDEARRRLADTGALKWLSDLPDSELFDRARIANFETGWPDSDRFFVDFGIRPVSPGVATSRHDAPQEYRVAVRVQSPRRIKGQVLQNLAERLSKSFASHGDDLFSVRWIGTVTTLATNAGGQFQPWKGPIQERLMVGSPVNINGGAVSAVTLILQNGLHDIFLTTGHSLHDDRRGQIGTAVYFPPQPFGDGLDPDRMAGTIEAISSGSVASDETDFAHTRLTPGFVPLGNKRFMFGRRQFALRPYPTLVPKGGQTIRMLKSAARTPEAAGHVTAFETRVRMYNPLIQQHVFVDHLVEVTFPARTPLDFGDSGALLCEDQQGTLVPAAILIAGVRAGRLENMNAPNHERACYALPLSLIPGLPGLEASV